jgi:hypothetical protein
MRKLSSLIWRNALYPFVVWPILACAYLYAGRGTRDVGDPLDPSSRRR